MSTDWQKKLNFMNGFLTEIASRNVAAMPHNKVGKKTAAIKAFMTEQAAKFQYSEYSVGTLEDLYNDCQKLWGPMASEYELMAESVHEPDSPEAKNREKLQLIKVTEDRVDEYHEVVHFSSVSKMVTLKAPFRFIVAHVNAMDAVVEEGRRSGYYLNRFTALLVDIGLKELRENDSTYAGQQAASKAVKQDVKDKQLSKDVEAEKEGNEFLSKSEKKKMVKAAMEQEEFENREAFDTDGKDKGKAKKEKTAAGLSTLDGDEVDRAIKYFTDPKRTEEVEEREAKKAKREDDRYDAQTKKEDERHAAQLANDMAIARMRYQQPSSSSSSSSSSSWSVTPAKSSSSYCQCAKKHGEGKFCQDCGLLNPQ